MALLATETLKRLSQARETPAVSLYLPTHRAGPDTRANPIRFKNRLQEAERLLEAQGRDEDDIGALLADAYKLLRDYDFWQHQADGLAMFLSPEELRDYRLPLNFEELTVVGERFHLKPLLPLLTGDGRFYLLAVSLQQARLFEGSHYSVQELTLEDTPTSLAEAIEYDVFEKMPQSYATSPGGAASYYGLGAAADDDRKEQVLRFFKALDNGVRRALQDAQSPLIFAGVDYLFPLYQEANHYAYLLDEGLEGNPDALRPEELHARAWQLVAPHFQQAREDAVGRYYHDRDKGQASGNLREILPAALDSRVDTLFVALGVQRWGQFDEETRGVTFHDEEQPGDEDLLDFAALHTFLRGGTTYAVPSEDVPGGGLAAAIYRY